MGMFYYADFRLHPLGHYLHLYSDIVTEAGISDTRHGGKWQEMVQVS